MPSSGMRFHSLHATSQALQPMHTEVSVKKPFRGGGSTYPASVAGSTGPNSLLLLIGPLGVVGAALRSARTTGRCGGHDGAAAVVDPGPAAVLGDVGAQRRAAGPPPRP